ncbi:transcription factor bHLH112-like [Andrographis paniculata]|uniref:transcription factor bHLH112-like n=1 Tax=Andrographis paniculata TaxID=175694 RepID=UPI0021E6DDCD|nr:transcription factor bHLH112-like [Andrographis paniculata]
MAEEFQGGVCGGSWWDSYRSNFFGSSPCSLQRNEVGTFGWHRPDPAAKDRPGHHALAGSPSAAAGDGGSMILHNVQNTSTGGPPVSMMEIGVLQSSTSNSIHDWNQDLLHDCCTTRRSDESSYGDILQEPAGIEVEVDYTQISCNPNSSDQCSETYCNQRLSAAAAAGGFPLNPTSYTCASSLLQTLFDSEQSDNQQSLLENHAMNNYSNFQTTPEFLPEVPPVDDLTFGKQHFADQVPLWNNTAAALMSDDHGSFQASTQPKYLSSPINNTNSNDFPSFNTKRQNEAGGSVSSAAKKGCNETTPKRPRIETPSPLPTFKVRKEKLGDRITALQQLVSPFGKTDTASVLHEAIEYIRFLHDQVSALCTPYLKNGSPQITDHKLNEEEQQVIEDLRSGGLCLVPISSTFPVAGAATDFWNPSFGGSFKL